MFCLRAFVVRFNESSSHFVAFILCLYIGNLRINKRLGQYPVHGWGTCGQILLLK